MTLYHDKNGITLYNGDNVDVMKNCIADASIDLVVTSPPYDNLRTYSAGKPIEDLWNFEAVAQQLWRIIKPGGVVVWVVADATVNGSETGTSFRQALRFMEIGFRLHDTMIYQKANAVPLTHNRYEQQWEFMFVLSHGAPSAFNPLTIKCIHAGRTNPSGTFRHDGTDCRAANTPKDVSETKFRFNVWSYEVGNMKSSKDAIAFKHPASFPEALARDHIISWSNEGDIVLDPFSGSGTTIKMAKLMGRKGIGIEINPEYCGDAVERLRQNVLF